MLVVMTGTKTSPPADPPIRELPTVLRDLAWTVHRLMPEVAELEPLPTTELVVLKQILGAPGITVTELARALGMRHSNVSATVRSLLARELVVRRPSPHDGRVGLLMPTDGALTNHEAIETVWSGTVRSAMRSLTDEQVRALEAAAPALEALDHLLHTRQQPEHD